ncbi:MAG: phosphatidylglycerol lysyltransferase domain-containing protein [Elusimicrobia bacterium]|nr:phosphatidylglycerol lysyltransferase domain-containing protein [Candidatus Liberimonas magnetica]
MITEYPVFENLSYLHKDDLSNAINAFNLRASEFSLGFLYGYRESFEFKLTRINSNICVYGLIDKNPSFLAPIGNNLIPATIYECFKYIEQKHSKGCLYSIDPKAVPSLDKLGLTVRPDRSNYDYVYRVSDLAYLTGSNYQAKRNFVKGFINKYEFEYLKLTPELAEECKSFQKIWCEKKRCKDDFSLNAENSVVIELLDNFEKLNLFGCVIKVKGVIGAFNIAEKMNETTALVHVEKADNGFRGIYQAVNNLFCKNDLLGKFEFVNREQDIGDEGLRKAKLSYHPSGMVEKYIIEL